jgi:hypothetical protein
MFNQLGRLGSQLGDRGDGVNSFGIIHGRSNF